MKRCTTVAAILAVALSGCGSAPRHETRIERPPQTARKPAVRAPAPAPAPAAPSRFPRGGGYYLDDGPGDTPPADLASIPEPVPQLEPLRRVTMRPYVVMGQTFTPMTELTPYKARGVASWYGRRYHGKQTSSGEIYDMYAISAAHPTLPIPSYARVTNVATGQSVVVRVNDRGPFLASRVIDLSYTAAHRIGVLGGGSALVDVETIIPDASGPGTAYASVRPAPRRAAVPAPVVKEPAPAAVAAPASGSEIDPILAIAAAARDVDPSISPEPAPVQVAAAAAQPAPRPVTGAAADAGGVYLQLGAFGSRENAESYLTRARTQIEWLGQLLHLVPRDDGIYRVHAGPYPSSWEARLAADRIASAIGIKPVVVTR